MTEDQFTQIIHRLDRILKVLPTNGHHQFPPMLEGTVMIGKYMGRHRNSVCRWIKKHKLPAHKTPNGRYMISTQAIDAWMRARYLVQHGDATT